MSLDHILESLQQEAIRQIGDIERATESKVEELLAAAKEQSALAYQKQIDAIQEALDSEKVRIINQAKLEATQLVLRKREELLSRAIDAAAQQLARLSAGSSYAQILKGLTLEAVSRFGGQDGLTIKVRACDVEVMMRIVEDIGIEATIENDPDTGDRPGWDSVNSLGGLIVSSEDRCIQLTNTFEVRLRRVAELYRSWIARALFDNTKEN